MKIDTKTVFSGALAVAAVLASGCRTIHSSDYSYYPKPKNADQVIEDTESTVAPAEIKTAEPSVETAVPEATVSVEAPKTGSSAAAALPVQDASSVGKPGTYREFVITDDGSDRSYAFTSDGLQGQTGRHVPAPAPAPDPVAKPAPAPAGSGYYVVQSGDILGRIARKHNVSEKAILAANPSVKDANRIRVGQKLVIPAPGSAAVKAHPAQGAKKTPSTTTVATRKAAATLPPKAGYTVYVVKQGDILGRIAKKNGTSVKAIMEANGITDDRKVRAGKAIYIPSGASAAPGKTVEDQSVPSTAPSPAAPVEPVPAPQPETASDPYLVI